MNKPNQQIVYRNSKYGFTLRFPGWWRYYCVVSQKRGTQETEYELHFRFKHMGKIYEDIFSLLVYRMTREEWVRQGYEESPVVFITEYDGRVFAYTTPEELPYAFIDKKTGDYNYKKYRTAIDLLKRMVNQDVPKIVSTLRFSRGVVMMRSMPYRSRKIWYRRNT